MDSLSVEELGKLKDQIHLWAHELGFTGLGISSGGLGEATSALQAWLAKGWHGEMHFMDRHTPKRCQPELLFPGVHRVISVRLNYYPETGGRKGSSLNEPEKAYIARYALGRDYHRLMRRKLQRLAERITSVAGPFRYRAFTDSAPVMEKPLAQAAGLGWIGKNTNLIHPEQGSWFFLGELYTDLPLPTDEASMDHCGSCTRCIEACPTGALDQPYQLDARRCIAYLTIEHKTAIPENLRPLIGNRIFGCDDCQLVCPHNQGAPQGDVAFKPRYELDTTSLLTLFSWTEGEFFQYTAGSAIRRLGYERWLRNLAVALGNSPSESRTLSALDAKLGTVSPMVEEHIIWAKKQLAENIDPEIRSLSV